MNTVKLKSDLATFIAKHGHFPTRREFRSVASEGAMYKEFGGMKKMEDWYFDSLPTLPSLKDEYLKTLRSSVCIVKYEKNGCVCVSALTLSPEILKPYVGKGTSKKANDDLIFAYDTDTEKFRCVTVSNIHSCIPLT